MYPKEEARELKSLFWTSFGKYMGKHQSASGGKVKWVNYKTGVNDIYFRLKCDSKHAMISIDIQHRDEGIRTLFLEQFQELQKLLTNSLGEEWEWDQYAYAESGQRIIRYSIIRNGVNLFRKDDWQEIFNFFEPRLVGLDSFWSEFNEVFFALEK
ncbi:MAG: hypothetical protein ACI9J3_004121 [Parvicellaceae bacterium]|jgi:hypothetical protein